MIPVVQYALHGRQANSTNALLTGEQRVDTKWKAPTPRWIQHADGGPHDAQTGREPCCKPLPYGQGIFDVRPR